MKITPRKIIITIILAVGYWLFMQHSGHERSMSNGVVTQETLQGWYKLYNEAYFGNTLPKDTQIVWVDFKDSKNKPNRLGETKCDDLSGCIIRLDVYYHPTAMQAEGTLLHEMCHVKTYDEIAEHGQRWQACMDTLWVKGAFKGII